jgi:hypothetical protein
MANYIKATNFTAKDALPSGNAGKIIKGTEVDVEFSAIATAIASKADTNSPTFTGTPLAPTANSGTNNTQVATTAFVTTAVAASFPTGGIILWSGSVVSIPTGWALCDGANGTPDLRNRFVVGAGSTYAVAATGGSTDAIVVSHTHSATSTVTDPGHDHTGYSNLNLFYDGGGGRPNDAPNGRATSGREWSTLNEFTGVSVSTSISTTGSSGTNANLPPYYALAYIMKL